MWCAALYIIACRAASVSERSEANDRGLFEISQYLYIYIIAERRALASEARPMIVVYSRFCNICIYIYIYIYHTVQVAMCAYSFVRTLVNALVLQ